MDIASAFTMSAVGSRVAYADDSAPEKALERNVFAPCTDEMKLAGEDSADANAGSKADPVATPDPSAVVMPVSEKLAGDEAMALMSLANAPMPCCVPAPKAFRTLPGLTGGSTPNPVGTFGALGDQPWVVLP